MSKDKTTMNTEDKGLNNSVSNGNQSTSSQAQSQRDYENLINKSLDEQITDVSISRADITNPNLHYGIEEEAEKIDDFVPQATKKESKLLSDEEKPLTETTERQTSDQNQKPIEELQTKELVGNDVPQTPGELASPNTPKGTDTPSTIAEGETTPENTAGNDDDPNEETGTPGGTTSGEETETFNPDLVTTGNSVDENAAEGTVIATLNLEDADGSVFVYFISDENGLPISNSDFKIVGNELVVSGTANLDFESLTSHNIFITAIDGGGNKVTEPFTININDVNEFDVSPITDTDATANSVTENASIGTSVGITAFASDDDGTNNGITYSLSNDAGGLFVIDPNTGEVTVAGAIDYETATSQTIEVTATSEDGSTSTQSFTININDVDEFDVSAISDTDASTNSVAENASIGTSVGITAFASDADGSNNGITYSLSNDAGGLFAIDPNTGEVTVAGAIDYETATSQTIEVTATSEDGSTSTQSFTININDVDEFDVSAITDTDSTANSVTENSSIGTSVGITAFASDADGSNKGITYSLSDDAGGLFAIDPNTGEVTVAGTIDYETATSQTIEVTATSEDGSTSTQSFTINNNDVDEFDVSAITDTDATTNSVAENAAIGTSVGITAFASDADGSNNGITYSLSDDASGLFTIDPNTGEVTVAGAIDYETATSQTIEVTATSEDGSTSTQSFTINVTDVDEFDVSAITDTDSTANSVTENASIGTSVGITAFASDADGSNNGITYSLSDDAGGLFAIDPNTGEVTVAGSIDYETATSQTIEVTATSEDGSTSTQSFTINVTDVDEFDVSAITDTNTDANAVDEDASVGTTVGITALATDADGTDTVTYSLSDDAGGLFTIDVNTGVVTVASGLDAETATSHNITVVATSTDGSTSNETFTISVNDVNETSISAITDNDGSANSVSEGAAVGTAVGITALATDADVTDTVTYSLSSNPGGFFAIDANTGVVTVASGLDFETNEDHTIEVTATSSDGTTSTETFTIDITDVDEFDVSAITDTDATTNSVAENSAVGTSVGITAFASDADGSNNGITYSLSDDASGLFAIDPNTGEVTVAGAIDYETATSQTIEVTATSEDGSTSTQSFTININDVDEFDVSAITDTDSTANSVAENASIGTSVGITAFASDADGTNNDITYSLSNDAGGLFTIDPNTGEVTVAGSIDYETATSQTIEVTATSEDGSTSTQSFIINITDVDEFDVSAITDTNTDANEVDEDASVGAVVGITALATDADGTDTVTYSLSDDAGGLFTIDANTGVITVASGLDAETATSHNITVVATSTDGSTSNETFTIGVNDVNETNISAISDTDSSANSVSEGAAVGTAVGITALATDADETDTVTYSLSSNPGGFFAIDANTGVVTVASGLDFETNEDHTIEVTATSSDGTTSTQNFTIDVTDVDEFDVSAITDTDTTTNSVTENASVGTSVGITAFASDADGSNNGVTYSLSDDAGGLFAIDPNTGEVTVAGAIDYETATSQTIEVTATSEDGSTSTQTFTVNIENANEGPTDITFTGGTVNETVEDGGTIGAAYDPSGTTVATLSTTDEDAGETFTYAITNDPSGHFEIVGNEVRVKAGQTIDYETATSHDITIEVTDSNGSTYSETITINVEDYEGSYTGANNADTHTGTSEEDTVSTGGGSDTIIGSDGADSIDGGTGKDTVDYSGSTEGVTVNFETGKGTGGQAEGDTYTNVENVIGSDHDDYVKGSYSEGTTANLGAGDDKFDNTQGYTNQHDVIDAGAGNDTVYTGDGNDTIDGGTGNDQLFGEGGNDTILGGDGDDSIRGGAGDDIITGGAGDDTIIGDEYLGTDNDTVVYTGNWADYTITQSGSYFTITDNRPGSPDGTDTVHTTIENFQFADATVPQADILNDAPTDITVSGGNIDENGSDGTVVATLGVTDADSFIPSETATYSITNDPSGNFEIVGNEVRLKAGSSLDFETDTTHDITVQVTDVHGATYSETITINVNDIDEFDVSAITDTNTDANAVDEDASVGSIVGITALATDADGSNNSVTYSLSDDAGGLFTIDANTGVVTVASGLDAETATSHNITVVATSTDGSTSNETFTINVNDVNETSISAITDNDSSANSVSESASVGTAVGITALATDADVTDTVTYSLSSNPGGFFAIDANTGVVTVASGLDFETNEDHTIEVTATSSDGTTSTETFTIDVTDDTSEASVSAITDTDSSANTVAENTSVGTSVGITAFATDADVSDNVTYSLSDDAGGLFAIDPNTGEVTVAGAIDYETATSQTIEVTATSDDGSTSTQSFTINVTDVDEFDVSAITDTDGTANSVAENATIGTSVGITAFASDADGSNNGITYSLSDDAGGLFAINPNTGEVTVAGAIDYETATSQTIEVTATSEDSSTSTQSFTININDVDEFDVSSITDTDATTNTVAENSSVGTSVGITAFASDADGSNNGVTYSINQAYQEHSLTATGGTSNGWSGSTDGLFNDDFNYDPTNPTSPMADIRWSYENDGFASNIANNQDAEITFSLDQPFTQGDTSNNFILDIYGRDIEQNRDDNFDIEVFDDNGNSLGTITGLGIPDGATPHLRVDITDGLNLAEGQTISSFKVIGHDSDTEASSNIFTLMEIKAASEIDAYQIDPNTGEVTVAGAIDYETSQNHTIEVTATSEDGSTSTQSFTINVTDVDEFDVSAITDTDSTANSVTENASIGTSVGITAFASDADGSNNGITYSLSDDAGGLFAIDPNTGEVTVAGSIDYETATSQTIEVTATSEDGSTSTQNFTINVTDVDEFDVSAITDTNTDANAVDEDASVGTTVGITALATDADGTDTVTYSLSDDAGGLFTIDANTGVVTVASGLDAETATSHNITVVATSTDGSTSNETFTISVNDVNETSISAITDNDGSANSVSEGAAVGTAVGITALATDADVTDTVTYSLSSNPGGFFAIDANTGVVTVANGLDFETNENHTIEVTATSSDGTTSTETFTIDVTDVDEFDVSAITDTDATTNSVNENASIGTSVGITAFASDADGSDNVTYSLSDDAGGLFTIDPNTGEVTVAGALDYENQDGHKIEVTATSDDGSTSTQEFKIAVTDVDEFDVSTITDTNTDANAVDEDASVGTTVGITALATDADGSNNSVTYSLSDDAGGLFTIDANTGVVTVASGLDAETATSHNITVVATSSDGSTSNETFTIGVNDVNETSISAITDNDSSTNSVAENVSVGTAVGITALATDADVTDTVTYSLSSNPGGFFAIDANTGVVTVASGLDFETNEDHTIEVTATSTDGTTSTETFTIDVTDVDEFDVSAITDTNTTANSVNENAAVGTSVGITAFASDADGSNNGITYSLSDDAGGLFAIDPNTGEVTVAGAIDYETATSQTIEVTATSEDGSTSTQSFSINVNDLNEAPVAQTVDLGATNEDTGIVITEAQLLANSSDVDAGTTLSITALTLQDNAHGSLTDNGNGTWTFNPTGDLSVNDVTFNFTVSDGTLTDSSTATIDVTAVADAPTLDLSTTSQDITTGSTTLESGFEGDTAAIGATGNNGFVGSMGGWMTDSDAIEVKTETLGDGSTNQFIELNNDAVDYYEDATNIYQEIDTTDGGTYTVDFNFAPRPGYDATINQIEVLVDGVVVKTISADGSSDSSINWQTDSITFTGDGTPARIEFREAGVDQNYGRGMYMDNISISEDLPEGHANGMENTAIALPDITAATTDTDGSETLAITITSIPEGAVLTDGTNTFTATVGDTDVDVTSWQLDSITMTPPEDFSGDITLTVNATATDGSDQNTTSSDISITVHDDDDTFTGTATEDLYNGGAGDDTINGNDGNDWLLGGEGDDTINGGNGDDVMTGGAGDDEINGGSGADTVVFSGNLADYSIAQSPDGSYLISDLRPGSPDGTDLISNVESFEFADQTVVVGDLTPTTTFDLNQFRTAGEGIIAFDDRSAELTDQVITGTDSNELLVGGAGNDTITAGGGDDDAAGRNGKDRISGGDGDDIILGGNGNDTLSGDAGNDAIDGGKGTGDTAEYSGNIYDYTVTQKDDGSLEIRDDRPGSPDGTDVVNNVENFQFADITVTAEELVADGFDVSAISDTNGSANAVTENASVGTAVGITALATDDDVSDNVTYSLSDDAGGLFAIDADTGVVTVAGSIDYETATSQTIEITATSKDGSTSTQSYTINVNDQDEFDVSAITDTDGTANTVTENVSVGTSVGITASASDADGSNNAVTYSLSDDAGGLFTIDPNTGEVTTAGDIDYETATSHTIEITATSSDGSTSTQNYTINVEDVAGQTITGTDITSTGGDTGSINTSNYSDTSSGYTVSAKNVVGGALTTASAANISTSGGLGANGTVSDSDSGQASQLGYDKASGLSEELIVDFDNAIDSANFSFANLYSSSYGEVGHWAVYDNGTLVAEGDFTESSSGTGSGTISINPDASFDQLIITGKLQTDGTDGSDFVVTDISYNEVETITGGNDTLTGTAEDDKISGLTGDDVLNGGDGNDTIYGGSSAGVETTSNVAITNASFESANLADGSSTGNLGGWTDVNDYGETSVWDPTTSSFTTTPDGENVLTLQEDNHVRQTLSESFDSNSDYELSFSVGNPMSTGSGDSWSVSIYSGNTLIGSTSGVEPAANAWQDVTISIDGDAYAAADGGALRIDIQNTETYTGSGDYIAFDNFELTKTSEINDGADTIYGGAGDDTINYGTGGDTVYGGDGNDTIDDVSGGTYNYNDTIDGGAGNDTIWSGGGDDTITGGAGNDWIDGEDGNDLFIFQEGDGNDTIYGGAGGGWTDTIQLQDELGGSDIGVYGTDWTVTLTEGTIQETNADNILFSDDADGTITLEDGSSIDFTDIERIDW